MSRSLDIVQAIKYPFRADNWMNTLLIPGLYLLGIIIITYVLQFTVGILASIFIAILSELNKVLGMLVMTGFVIFMAGITIALQAPLMGYQWEVIGNLRAHGYDAPAPDWKPLRKYLMNGLKFMAFCLALGLIVGVIPAFLQVVIMSVLGKNDLAGILIMLVSLVFSIAILGLTPFLYAPIIRTSESKSLGEMFDVESAIEAGRQCYGKVMLALLVSIGLFLIAIPLLIFSFCTIIGYPMLLMGLSFIIFHLVTQAFDAYREV